MTLLFIIMATLAGGVLSVLAAAALSLSVLTRYAARMISFSVGVLLAVAFLDLLPEAAEALPHGTIGATVLCGMMLFFLLEKLALWRHDHGAPGTAGVHSPAGEMIMFGDGLHNFVDGILIAAAFLHDPILGVTTTIAVIAHEIPQEVGDFMILLASGYSRRRALALNLLSGLAALAGGILGYFALHGTTEAVPYLLCVAAAGFIYISMVDLVPLLQRQRRPADALLQPLLMLVGLEIVLVGHRFVG